MRERHGSYARRVDCGLCLGRLIVYFRCWCAFPLKNASGRESAFFVMRGLTNAFTLPPNGRGGRTPLDERDGFPVVTSTSVRFQTFRPFGSRLSTRIQPIEAQHYSGTIGEIWNVCLYKWHVLVAEINSFLA